MLKTNAPDDKQKALVSRKAKDGKLKAAMFVE